MWHLFVLRWHVELLDHVVYQDGAAVRSRKSLEQIVNIRVGKVRAHRPTRLRERRLVDFVGVLANEASERLLELEAVVASLNGLLQEEVTGARTTPVAEAVLRRVPVGTRDFLRPRRDARLCAHVHQRLLELVEGDRATAIQVVALEQLSHFPIAHSHAELNTDFLEVVELDVVAPRAVEEAEGANANVATGDTLRYLAVQRAVELPQVRLRQALVVGAMGHGTAVASHMSMCMRVCVSIL